jgi:hypothetical protein
VISKNSDSCEFIELYCNLFFFLLTCFRLIDAQYPQLGSPVSVWTTEKPYKSLTDKLPDSSLIFDNSDTANVFFVSPDSTTISWKLITQSGLSRIPKGTKIQLLFKDDKVESVIKELEVPPTSEGTSDAKATFEVSCEDIFLKITKPNDLNKSLKKFIFRYFHSIQLFLFES